MRMLMSGIALAMVLSVAPLVRAQGQSTQTPPPTPKPQPFPGSSSAPPPAKSPTSPAQTPRPTPSTAPAQTNAPSNAQSAGTLGAPIYPGATPLETIDVGNGQKIYLFGTNAPYADIVTYYRNILKSSGRELFKAPAMQQFDIGKFQEDTMSFQPSVVVKDYTWNNQEGYLVIDGTKEQRFKTVIQIVPPTVR